MRKSELMVRGMAAVVLGTMFYSTPGTVLAQETSVYSRDELVNADYARGRLAFQQRCSACHTLAEDSGNLSGPNLYGMFGSKVGTRNQFDYSEAMKNSEVVWTPEQAAAFAADPAAVIPGTVMVLPEGVPQEDRLAMVSFMMVETGGADWPRPASAMAVTDPDAPISERFPSFWNHLMFNTTRYRMVTDDGELVFHAYYNTDGTVSSDVESVRGFWQIDERDFFCYSIQGVPLAPGEFVECFPVVAMSIPRFATELWESHPRLEVTLHGGILPGRPEQ